jgi:hypothetical protein
MSIAFPCSACGFGLKAPDSCAGRQSHCFEGRSLTVNEAKPREDRGGGHGGPGGGRRY